MPEDWVDRSRHVTAAIPPLARSAGPDCEGNNMQDKLRASVRAVGGFRVPTGTPAPWTHHKWCAFQVCPSGGPTAPSGGRPRSLALSSRAAPTVDGPWNRTHPCDRAGRRLEEDAHRNAHTAPWPAGRIPALGREQQRPERPAARPCGHAAAAMRPQPPPTRRSGTSWSAPQHCRHQSTGRPSTNCITKRDPA